MLDVLNNKWTSNPTWIGSCACRLLICWVWFTYHNKISQAVLSILSTIDIIRCSMMQKQMTCRQIQCPSHLCFSLLWFITGLTISRSEITFSFEKFQDHFQENLKTHEHNISHNLIYQRCFYNLFPKQTNQTANCLSGAPLSRCRSRPWVSQSSRWWPGRRYLGARAGRFARDRWPGAGSLCW